MSRESEFAAEILERGATAYAGYAVHRLFELEPGAREQFAGGASENWRSHIRSRLLELAVAVRLEAPDLFRSRILWNRDAFRARSLPDSFLENSLTALSETLSKELPENTKHSIESILGPAIQALTEKDETISSAIDAETGEGQLALRYLASTLEGDSRGAIEIVLDAVRGGLDPRDAVTRILFPAQREVGRMWHHAESDVAEEHLLTATTLRVMAILGSHAKPERQDGRTVVVAAVEGNDHVVAVEGLGLFFELEGWKSVVLGANVPSSDLIRSVQLFGAGLLVLSVTLGVQLREAARTIQEIRAIPEFDVRILVGGPAFDESDGIWRRIGADGHAGSLDQAVEVGERLLRG